MAIKYKHIHPFPARMAPEIALNALKKLDSGSIILDPMTGSGTVLHHAAMNGHKTIGYDLDPLAVLLSSVATKKIDFSKLLSFHSRILKEAKNITLAKVMLPWIDENLETTQFVKYWFARTQRNELRKISYALQKYKKNHPRTVEIDVLRIALSKIIITKKVGASLAWDISHSRPHKVKDINDFDVFKGYEKSVAAVIKNIQSWGLTSSNSRVTSGDARNLQKIPDAYVDKVITSPPYLNAIDYMRGHKFSLIWLGYSIPELRKIRSISVGVEKNQKKSIHQKSIDNIYKKVVDINSLKSKQESMIKRYINDSIAIMSEISRVLKKGKTATLVIGNSTLNGVFIKNSQIYSEAGKLVGLKCQNSWRREIPQNRRYLPTPLSNKNSLGKRMRFEIVATFINELL